MNLSEFLLARISEDEEVAAEAGGDGWEQADDRKVRWQRGNAHGWAAFADLPTAAAHIARWDPARVLAECEAKRRIVERAKLAAEAGDSVVTTGAEDAVDLALEGVLELLALPYADHPDYDPTWRP